MQTNYKAVYKWSMEDDFSNHDKQPEKEKDHFINININKQSSLFALILTLQMIEKNYN